MMAFPHLYQNFHILSLRADIFSYEVSDNRYNYKIIQCLSFMQYKTLIGIIPDIALLCTWLVMWYMDKQLSIVVSCYGCYYDGVASHSSYKSDQQITLIDSLIKYYNRNGKDSVLQLFSVDFDVSSYFVLWYSIRRILSI